MREPIHLRTVRPFAEPLRMLVGRMAQLARGPVRQTGHVHPVVIDQPQGKLSSRHGHQQHVAVLQVGMGHARLAQPQRQLRPQFQQLAEHLGTIQIVLDELVEVPTLPPIASSRPGTTGPPMRMPESRYWKSTVKGSLPGRDGPRSRDSGRAGRPPRG